MTMQELVTAVRYSLPVVVVVFDGGVYSLEKHRMQKEGMIPFGLDLKTPDFASFATACGAEGFRGRLLPSLNRPLIPLTNSWSHRTHSDQPLQVRVINQALG